MRALLFEADGTCATRVAPHLAAAGWSCVVAPDLEGGLAAFLEQPFPLIVLAGTRIEPTAVTPLVERIRTLPRGETACVVAAYAGEPPPAQALLAAGVDDLLDLRLPDEHVLTRLACIRTRVRKRASRASEELLGVFERALRESEVRYRALFDQSPVGVFLCDRSLRITDINERLRQITGLPRGRMLGMELRDADQPPVPGLTHAVVDAAASYDGPYLHPDGSQRWVTVRYAPLRDPDGRVVGGIGVVEDVTERHRSDQRLLMQAAELERVNSILRERTLALEDAMQARTRLYTSMNHELRTPISAIMLYQELMMTGALGTLTDDQRQALERSHNATRHLLELVCDILDLSKLEAGRIVLHPTAVRLDELLRELMGTMQPVSERYGSELRLELEERLPQVVTDPQRVRQILLNLISNAAKFGRGHPIVVRGQCGLEGMVVVEVQDRGIGIDPADVERIFDDFVQVGSPPETGTGLGLSISRRLATLLEGSLEVDSSPGEGSTFRLILPGALREESAALIDATT